MKLFIWTRVERLTYNYHDEGGVAIVAPSLELARSMLLNPNINGPCTALTKPPDAVYEVSDEHVPVMYVFPDAGCC